MKHKRAVIILLVNILVLVVLSTALALTAAAASNPEKAASSPEAAALAASLEVTVINTNTGAVAPGNIATFFDANESNTKNNPAIDFLAGHYVGARICNVGDAPATNVEAEFSSTDIDLAFDGEHVVNEFELGIGETVTRSLLTLNPADCKVAYYYVLTPRWKTGGVHGLPAEDQTASFTITASADGIADASDSGTMQMVPGIEASPNSIVLITEETALFFTITVVFDLGNIGAGGGAPNDVTFNPTGWISTNVGPFQLSDVILVLPEISFLSTDDRLYYPGIEIQNLAGTITYTFRRAGFGSTTFAPVQVVNSGAQNQKWNRSEVDVALAIDLSTISAGLQELPIAVPLAVVFVLSLATLLVARRWMTFRKSDL